VPFLITSSYLLSFLFIRLSVLIAGSANSEIARVVQEGSKKLNFHIGRNIILFGYHIHHFYFGIIMIALAGWLSILGHNIISREKQAILYGAGLGLLMDEIGLLLTWGDYYSGLTYLLSLLLMGIFLNIIFFPSFWRVVRKGIVENQAKTYKNIGKILFVNHINIVKLVDNMSDKMNKARRFSPVFIGIIYFIMGIMILVYPDLIYYWVAAGFFFQGISLLIRGFSNQSKFN
jgi:hypothetical protein